MPARRVLSLGAAVLGAVVGLWAQLPGITRYDLDDGLPQSMVNHVLQDREGFIWLGTGDGLARFDGTRMVVYKHDPRDSTSLSHNAIWGLAEADAHHLWVGTRTGLDRLDRRTGRFTHVGSGSGVPGCWQPVRTTTDTALFYSPLSRDLLHVAAGGTKRTATRHLDSYSFFLRGGNEMCLYVRDSIIIRPLDGGPERVVKTIPTGKVCALIDVGPKWLLLSDRDGWLVRPDGTREEVPAALRACLRKAQGLKHAARDPQGRLWLALSNTGVLQLRDDLTIAHSYTLLPPGEGPLALTGLSFDRQGNTWVGTDGKGVIKLAPQRIKFGPCMAGMGLPWEPPSWFVRGFAQWDAHRVLVAFHLGGLALFDERTGTLEPLVLPGFDAHASWSRLFNDSAGTPWAQHGGRVYILEQAGGHARARAMDQRPHALLRDAGGHAVLYTAGGSARYRREGNGWQITALPAAFPDSIARLAERIALDPLGQWWCSGTLLPISAWKEGVRLPLAGGAPHSEAVMTSFTAAGANEAWMTTSDGLYRWSLADRRILRHYTIHDGLPDQYLYMMLPAGDGTWWISSNKGLSHFRPQRPGFRNYGAKQGLQSREFNTGAALRSASGLLYFGGVNGFNRFRPEAVEDDPDTALVRVVATFAADTPVPIGQDITLPFRRNELRIELAVLEFTAPENNRYAYRLQGYDTTWHRQEAARPITFTNLPHGRYTLMAKGINADGTESPEQALLTILVPLPFWASLWTITLAAVLLAAAVGYAVYAVQRGRARRKSAGAERELRELRLRTRLAKDIHDDVGSGLARMAALARSSKRGQDAPVRFDKLAGISTELLDNLRDVVWMNDPRHDTLDALLLRISDHARDLFEESGTRVVARYPDPLPTWPVDGTFRRNLFLIAKEALQNAHKYGAATCITLHWDEHDGGYTLAVADDGRGITTAVPQGSGHGTDNMRQRAQDIGAHFARTSVAGEGTTIRIQGRSFGR
ncbi:MAG: hypothetical protein KBH07_04695 [Flavobacteriales bacterium]|nr:hypothetical protein [Flavobacteriales bacterium]MBP9080826.1 hypothetical protein [Flavobacteriales bacterium]